mmetsp:Transcript_21865/g.40141  ORF Transcript_21865/g.40141 Transcript_21865/m.40141 type:complete len:151 (-) Transcript_21865:105-557(-)
MVHLGSVMVSASFLGAFFLYFDLLFHAHLSIHSKLTIYWDGLNPQSTHRNRQDYYSVPLYQRWACLELRSGDLVTAKRLIREALTKDKRKVGAKIDEETGNFGLVGLISRRGIECAPGDTELHRILAEHEISRGKIGSGSCYPMVIVIFC